MTDAIDLTNEQRSQLNSLLRQHLPGVTVWAYGSRVKWTARPNSDLDLVVFSIPAQGPQVADLKDALAESNLPFPVDLHVWDDVPERFREIIQKEYVVMQEAKEPERKTSMPGKWRTATVRQLVDEQILEKPIDGNHGEIHPKTSDFFERGIPFIMASDLVNGRVDTTNCAFISEEQARTLRKGFSKPGDVLISHKATMGRTAIVEDIGVPFVILTPQVTYYRVKDPTRLSHRYLKLYFDSPTFQQLFETWGQKGSTRAYLGITSQLDLPIVLPAIEEQRAIAHILGTLDDKIELNRKMNETLEAMARALFKSWFVDFDPVRAKAAGRDTGLPNHLADLFPDSFEDSELGEIPTGWGVGSILQHARLISGGTPKTDCPEYWDGPIPWASAKDVSQSSSLFLVETERSITERGLDQSATQVVPAFCSAVVARGATTGRMVLFGRDMAMNQTCYALVTTTSTPFALYCRLLEEIDTLVHAAHGSVFDTITTSTFASSRIVLPPPSALKAFEARIAPLFQNVLNSVSASRTLTALRDTLLPKLLSGELSLKK